MVRLIHSKATLDVEFEFINKELPPDPEYAEIGTYKSASMCTLVSWYHRIKILIRRVKSQAKELTRMQRRNLKLQQKITKLSQGQKCLRQDKQHLDFIREHATVITLKDECYVPILNKQHDRQWELQYYKDGNALKALYPDFDAVVEAAKGLY